MNSVINVVPALENESYVYIQTKILTKIPIKNQEVPKLLLSKMPLKYLGQIEMNHLISHIDWSQDLSFFFEKVDKIILDELDVKSNIFIYKIINCIEFLDCLSNKLNIEMNIFQQHFMKQTTFKSAGNFPSKKHYLSFIIFAFIYKLQKFPFESLLIKFYNITEFYSQLDPADQNTRNPVECYSRSIGTHSQKANPKWIS